MVRSRTALGTAPRPTVPAPGHPYDAGMTRTPPDHPLAVPQVTPLARTHPTGADRPLGPGPVVYWMQHANRTDDNAALEHAIALAARWDRSIAIVGAVDPGEPGLTLRSLAFALQGLRDVRDAARRRGIGVAFRRGPPDEVALAAARGAAALVCDRGYLRFQRAWRGRVAEGAPVPVVEVEGDVVVPVAVASSKVEYAARTIRPKIRRVLDDFRDLPPRVEVGRRWGADDVVPGTGVDLTAALDDPVRLAREVAVDHAVGPVGAWFVGGQAAAAATLERFVTERLGGYAAGRNQPQRDAVSYLGMYLRHGHVAAARALHEVVARADAVAAPAEAPAAFVEELVVRRELAVNLTWFDEGYDRYASLPTWARATLARHVGDEREASYGVDELEAGATHDPYWNAAMLEMRATGYLHNHMRMYWGKRVLAWSDDPERAFGTLLALNDRYLVDGRDPNSYAGVAWVFGRHDRPWPERPVFGTVRSMVPSGLERKADPRAYVQKVERRVAERRLLLDGRP